MTPARNQKVKSRLGILLILVTSGCVPGIQGVCRHEATYAVAIYGEQYQTRVAVGEVYGVSHAQAQANMNGQWKYLCATGREVDPCEITKGFKVDSYVQGNVWLLLTSNRLKR